ncbi:MAG: hypothetical protein ISS57_09425 [Anaerolineales bacterium]|nr:hypothetical protein [Anaerolineales bacterium]
MDAKIIKTITNKVSQKFPEVLNVKPQVKKQPKPENSKGQNTPNFLLLYKTQAKNPKGKSIPRVVRVVVSPHGKIIKMTTSK